MSKTRCNTVSVTARRLRLRKRKADGDVEAPRPHPSHRPVPHRPVLPGPFVSIGESLLSLHEQRISSVTTTAAMTTATTKEEKPSAASDDSGNGSRDSYLVQSVIVGRKTVRDFDETRPVDDSVLHRAIRCAFAANDESNHRWRFIKIGEQTAKSIAELSALATQDEEKQRFEREHWLNAPGCCVVTSTLFKKSIFEQEDYVATTFALHNFMLSMWAEGIGTRWTSGDVTRTKEFARLCGVRWGEEHVVGCICYGFEKPESAQAIKNSSSNLNRHTVENFLTKLP